MNIFDWVYTGLRRFFFYFIYVKGMEQGYPLATYPCSDSTWR